jgi:hypothetical protein
MHTTAFWLHFPEPFLACFAGSAPTEKQDGLVGLAAPCEPWGRYMSCAIRATSRLTTEAVSSGLKTFEPNLYLTTTIRAESAKARRCSRLTPSDCYRSARGRGAARIVPGEVGAQAASAPGEVGEREEMSRRILSELRAVSSGKRRLTAQRCGRVRAFVIAADQRFRAAFLGRLASCPVCDQARISPPTWRAGGSYFANVSRRPVVNRMSLLCGPAGSLR